MKNHLSGILNPSGPPGHWNDAKTISTFLLGPAGLNDPTRSYSPLWCVLDLGGINNEGSDCASWGLLPSFLAI